MAITRSLYRTIIVKTACPEMPKTPLTYSLTFFSLLILTFAALSSISLSLVTAVPEAAATTASFTDNIERITENDGSKIIIVALNGSNSTDPDGTITSYKWEQLAGSPKVTLSDLNAANPTFSIPTSMLTGTFEAADTTLTFRLTVTDNNGASDSSDVNVVLKGNPFNDERDTSSLAVLGNSSTKVTSAMALENATATDEVALASPLSAISPVIQQNTTLSLSASSSDSDTDPKQQQLVDTSVQNQSSSRLPVMDNDGDRNLTINSTELLRNSKSTITSTSGMPNERTSNNIGEKFSVTDNNINNNNNNNSISSNVNDIDNSIVDQFPESNGIPAVQGTEQPFQLFWEGQQPPPQQLFDDGKGQRGQEGGLTQQLQQNKDSQGLPFSFVSPVEGLMSLRSEGTGLGVIENGTAVSNELSPKYSSQILPPDLLTAPAPEPLLSPFHQLPPPATLAVPLYSSGTNPPDTVIISAIDNSTGLSVQNGPIATSDSITLTFWGTDDSGISGYICSIDGLAAFTCSSPIVLDSNIFQTIQSGSMTETIHTFQVSAIDNSGMMDPTPAILNWIMTDPSAIQTVPLESLALTQTPDAGSSSLSIPLPQQPAASQPPIEQQQQQPQITVPEQITSESILGSNSIQSYHSPPQITIPTIQAPLVALN